MARWCAAAVLALLCACSDSEEPAFDAQAWRIDCLAQVADLEAAAVLRQARRELAVRLRRTAEILREGCRLGAR